jgi:serine O-acetyltransferase
VKSVKADHDTVCRYGAKYGGGSASGWLPVDLIRKIGFQMMFAYRVMRLFKAVGAPLAPEIISRLIRHLYGADIHWAAEFEPGVMIVHGMGICISHAARVGSGAILFQGVTLGASIDPESRAVGAPCVERDVHVGPGATLIGPITIGMGSKIAAGCVVTRSIPRGSLVEASVPEVRARVPLSEKRGTK